MVKDKIDGHEWSKLLARAVHGQVHDFVPAFLREDLEHGHDGLRASK
jgi:hypothetical protein